MGEKVDLQVAVPVEKVENSTALGNGEKLPSQRNGARKSSDRDAALAQVEKDKKLSFIRAWEDGEKAKAENKAQKKKASITAWENSKRAALEAKLKKVEQNYENKKAEYAEKIKNKMAMIHKAAEEKRAEADAKCGKELLKAEESAAKYKATGQPPKKAFSCFGGILASGYCAAELSHSNFMWAGWKGPVLRRRNSQEIHHGYQKKQEANDSNRDIPPKRRTPRSNILPELITHVSDRHLSQIIQKPLRTIANLR